ncbi:Erythronolide synthase, modules 1 and 2 [Serratia rubidaea]|uniref:Erythronolide synthase, modules 1 and 2 n=1 Tax=Serratia rubidaea TaxID=61652 RepID=A0A447QUD8_SERRU|nr:Erythronolide synthase, modules 1 and 2 [Serratia rubidaea]
MKQRVIASGWGQCSPLAADVPTLIEAIAAGRCATSAPWFDNDDDWQNLRLGNNPHTARAARADAAPWQQLQPVIDEALTMAGLSASALQGPRVRVFLAGNGMRPNIADFAGYQDRNDAEDLLFFPAIKQLHADSYAQDALARRFVETYRLDWPPTSVYSASNSSLTALHLAQAGIAAGQTDVALVAGWLKIVLQDVVFMGGQDMLGNGQSQPFNNQDNSVLLADGAVALVIESEEHARRRGVTPAIAISSSVCRQSSGGRGGAFTADFRTIAQTIDGALQAAGLTPQDIACALRTPTAPSPATRPKRWRCRRSGAETAFRWSATRGRRVMSPPAAACWILCWRRMRCCSGVCWPPPAATRSTRPWRSAYIWMRRRCRCARRTCSSPASGWTDR